MITLKRNECYVLTWQIGITTISIVCSLRKPVAQNMIEPLRIDLACVLILVLLIGVSLYVVTVLKCSRCCCFGALWSIVSAVSGVSSYHVLCSKALIVNSGVKDIFVAEKG